MAKCYNCGTEIPADDKLRLCDRCKSVLLPFIKFTDASTSSAVRRLIANERNLRARGVTDNGMDYLMRICEAHDQAKIEEQARRDAERTPKAPPQPQPAPQPAARKEEYLEIDLPIEAPLDLHRESYGSAVGFVQILLILCGIAFLGWAVYQFVSAEIIAVPCIVAAVGSFAVSALCPPLKKLIHDMDELKKRFR